MPGRRRENPEQLPEFYIRPSINGRLIDPEIRAAFAQLWPWFWNYVGKELGDPGRAADLADEVAYRISSYINGHPGQVRSLVGFCRVAAVNLVNTTKKKEGRIDYRGLTQEIEATLSPTAPDWQEELELSICVDQALHGQDREARTMLQRRLMDETWDQIGESLGLTAGQARLRFRRALERIRLDVVLRGGNRGRS